MNFNEQCNNVMGDEAIRCENEKKENVYTSTIHRCEQPRGMLQ